MFPMEDMKYYLWGQHWCSSGLWKQIEGAHVNHQWEISRSRCSPSRNLKGHTWTIDWRTISLWPWSRERSRETMRLPRLYWSFGNNNLEEIGGSRPLYSSPAMWSWGSRINAFLSEYNIFDIWCIRYINTFKDKVEISSLWRIPAHWGRYVSYQLLHFHLGIFCFSCNWCFADLGDFEIV